MSRSSFVTPLISRQHHRGVRVIGAQDGFGSISRAARMQAGMSGIMSEEFRAQIADRGSPHFSQGSRAMGAIKVASHRSGLKLIAGTMG